MKTKEKKAIKSNIQKQTKINKRQLGLFAGQVWVASDCWNEDFDL